MAINDPTPEMPASPSGESLQEEKSYVEIEEIVEPILEPSREKGIFISQKTLSALSVPVAIIIAGALVAGAVYFSGSRNAPRSAGTPSPTGSTTTQPGAPSAQPPQGGSANSGPVNVSADDDPFKGNPNAKVTLIEFSDFQCPFCRRFFEDTLSQIEDQYVKTGKVKFVYRDFPLSFHAAAQKAAEAGECADEQEKFWEMHDKIFQEQAKEGSGTIDFNADDLKQWASQIGLQSSRFNECLDGGKYAEEVKKDSSDGQAAGVTGTPGFFVNGRSIVGAQPFSAFQTAIDEELNKVQ